MPVIMTNAGFPKQGGNIIRAYIGTICGSYITIMEKKMETTI